VDFNQLITALATNGIGAVCAAAVLWLAWFRETKTIPKMMETFSEVQQKAMDTATALAREERQVCQKWHEENRANLIGLLEEMRENKHFLRDLAHMLGVRRAVEEEQAKKRDARRGKEEQLP
jgi:hypothetical protein